MAGAMCVTKGTTILSGLQLMPLKFEVQSGKASITSPASAGRTQLLSDGCQLWQTACNKGHTTLRSSPGGGSSWGLERVSSSRPGRLQGLRRLRVSSQKGDTSSTKQTLEPSSKLPETEDEQISAWNQKTPANTMDMMKLFNDAQQNMLYLNKQRLIAIEELQKAERDRELLLAKVSQLEADVQASEMEKDLLGQRLKASEGSIALAESRAGGGIFRVGDKRDPKADPPALWSSLLLAIDNLLLGESITRAQATGLRELVQKRDMRVAEAFVELKGRPGDAVAQGLVPLLDQKIQGGVHVIHVCTELAPLAQAGTLAAEVTGLCRALRRKGHLVEVVLPKYDSMDLSVLDELQEAPRELYSYFDGEWHRNKVWTGVVFGIPVTLIDPQHPQRFFTRENMYDYEDDFERFTYFSRAALEYIQKVGKQPDVLHLHNWQTAAIAPLFWDIFYNAGLQNTRIMFTCHDFKYQCTAPPEKLALCGLDHYQLNRPDRLQDNLNPSLINLLKGGIVYSNKVTTASQTYASDIKVNLGYGLEPTLQQQESKIVGILSGLNEMAWNPERDPALSTSYSAEDPSGKEACRASLRDEVNLPQEEVPLVGCIAPAVTQTDLELIRAALTTTLQQGGQFVFVGSSREPRVQVQLEDLALEFGTDKARVEMKWDDSLAHRIIAGSDIIVCPAVYEPTNQLQIVALRYGSLPVARQLYGQNDVLYDVDSARRRPDGPPGFPFASTEAADLTSQLSRALAKKVEHPDLWAEWVKAAMRQDFSWDGKSSDDYLAAYYQIRRC